jgi:hypothetical protein
MANRSLAMLLMVVLVGGSRLGGEAPARLVGAAGVGTPVATPGAAGQLVADARYAGVIVSAAEAPGFFRSFFGESAEGYWTPQAADVARLEAALPTFLREAAAARSPDLWQRLPEYTRQYVGIVEDGRERVLVNAFCDDFSIDWRSTPVAVEDGGDCFFHVTYDVTVGTFAALMINGEA